MARIPRDEHATIRQRVDVEGQKVAEVAAAYGCTPANIYAILAKQRRQVDQDAGPSAPSTNIIRGSPAPALPDPVATDLLGELAEGGSEPAFAAAAAPETAAAANPAAPAAGTPRPRPKPAAPASSTARTGKAGYGLLLRTSDGEETVHPFRSLDELLSAAKPILRTAARSPEPIWFSIQQVDLDALDDSF